MLDLQGLEVSHALVSSQWSEQLRRHMPRLKTFLRAQLDSDMAKLQRTELQLNSSDPAKLRAYSDAYVDVFSHHITALFLGREAKDNNQPLTRKHRYDADELGLTFLEEVLCMNTGHG